MDRLKRLIAMTVIVLLASGVTLIAQGRGGGGQKPKTQTTVPKATAGAPKAPQGAKVNAQPVKPVKASGNSGKTTKATAPVTKSAKASPAASAPVSGTEKAKPTKAASGKKSESSTTTANAGTSTSTSTTSTTPTTSTSTTEPTTLTAVQQKLQKNTNLASKLQSRLPKGTDLMTAADGFRNLGQFVAAVNVSNNLGLDFTQLKMKMVDEKLSLGQSIQSLKPVASGSIEAQRAEYEARGMIAESETQASATATVTTNTTTQKTKGKKPSGSRD